MKNFRYKWFYKLSNYQPARPEFFYDFIDWIRYEMLWDKNDDRHNY